MTGSANRYVRLQRVGRRLYDVKLVVGNQAFKIDLGYSAGMDYATAIWLRGQLGHALDAIIANETRTARAGEGPAAASRVPRVSVGRSRRGSSRRS